MPFLYNIGFGENKEKKLLLGNSELKSLLYHNIFDYPLTERELVKWVAGTKVEAVVKEEYVAKQKNGLYFLKGKEGVVYKRLLKKRISARKIQIAKKTANLLSAIPTIKLIAITGSLAMENASDNSDVDLLIVTKKDALWTTRLITYFVLRIMNYELRKPGDQNQKDKLCMNMWLDESDLSWPAGDRNSYTAHEIAQIKPLLNKNGTYEKFMDDNVWLKDYWPNAVHAERTADSVQRTDKNLRFIEKLAFKLQLIYMRRKITREIVTPNRAIFHPYDWGEVVLARL